MKKISNKDIKIILALFVTITFDVKIFSQVNPNTLNESCPFQLINIRPITDENAGYTHPKISPDGTNIIMTKHHYQGIYLINLSEPDKIITISDEPKVGYGVEWSENGEEVIYYHASTDSNGQNIKTQTIYKLAAEKKNNENVSPDQKKEKQLQVSYNLKDKKVRATDGTISWEITKDEGVYYSLRLSPDQKYVLVHKNDGQMYLYAADGSGVLAKIGRGLCQSWSPDSKYIIYHISHSRGKDYIVDSDLFLYSIEGNTSWKLTNTPEKIENWPYWSNNNLVVFSEENSGQIFLAEIITK